MIDEKVEGWGDPEPFRSTSKYHFYKEDGRSLCGRYGRFCNLPELFDEKDNSSANCAACRKKILKHRKGGVK